jgi:hypothetical protein
VTEQIDVFDLASETDLNLLDRLMTKHPVHTFEVIYSPYILLVWEDQFKTVRVSYFERQSQKDMKLAEDILNSQNIIHKNFDVKFPFAVLKWTV